MKLKRLYIKALEVVEGGKNMNLKRGLVLICTLLLAVFPASIVLYKFQWIEFEDIFSLCLEGITFLSIFFFLLLTIKLKAHKLLIIGCLFVSVAAFLSILDVIDRVVQTEFIDVYLENGLFTLGIAMCSFGVLFLLNQEKEMNEKLKHQATHDPLTNLYNWNKVNDFLISSMAESKEKNKQLAIMFLDLDRFKFINDTKGHTAGDHVLQEVSKRLMASVGEEDFVARKGGDEFLVIMKDVDKHRITQTAERVLHSIREPFLVCNDELSISASIGISVYPQDGESKEELIHKADNAMYLAKKLGKNNYQFVIQKSEDALNRRTKLELELGKAIYNNELFLHYQPQIELSTGKLKGVEALLRWNHPVFGAVSPEEFIPIAEENGLIVPIGEMVIEQACKQNRLWQNQGFPPVRIAVNVSAIQFQNSNLITVITAALKKYDILPEYLEIEITESVMHDVRETSEILRKLKEAGVTVSIDDFGTGYSSLNVLHRLTIDYVKIDKSFVQEIFTSQASASLVKSIIDIGETMNFKLIAEGIEDKEQAEFLKRNGSHLGQGFYYSRPLPVEKFEAFMRAIDYKK